MDTGHASCKPVAQKLPATVMAILPVASGLVKGAPNARRAILGQIARTVVLWMRGAQYVEVTERVLMVYLEMGRANVLHRGHSGIGLAQAASVVLLVTSRRNATYTVQDRQGLILALGTASASTGDGAPACVRVTVPKHWDTGQARHVTSASKAIGVHCAVMRARVCIPPVVRALEMDCVWMDSVGPGSATAILGTLGLTVHCVVQLHLLVQYATIRLDIAKMALPVMRCVFAQRTGVLPPVGNVLQGWRDQIARRPVPEVRKILAVATAPALVVSQVMVRVFVRGAGPVSLVTSPAQGAPVTRVTHEEYVLWKALAVVTQTATSGFGLEITARNAPTVFRGQTAGRVVREIRGTFPAAVVHAGTVFA
eukprot:TRINITY_DN10049_c0_g1_i4.p2 TRINITY_DN10049_c0_g1~~TRINITY_DN10049_c0_g1_i4.p2  ORF type:complete len:424 (-),score=27.76 TRINITY_DN10049_c0_g1_i4:2322-3425(-)